ncbi:MAG: GSCFA domain-containing protein [Winogradskyella sp.]|uniref:GSCFA domain-containing protein n=1 Tax=Winogradskyella sp. TaxID=1883156 RepID=UPI0017C66FEE|nr:GSCFA domain-containing protein [Winogradskyella sp.]
MKFKTEIPLEKQAHNQMSYNSEFMLLGSCFTENIGEKLKFFKFQTEVNPLGILFHPLAIENVITRAINKDYFTEKDLHQTNEQWFSFEAHSKLNSTSKEDLLINLNEALNKTRSQLAESTHVVITLGTAWVYRHIESDAIVANCHKVPQKQFLKELLSVNTISESLNAITSLVKLINPEVTFIFTVSPVRHLKDGFVENTQSKSHLIAAIHQCIDQRHNKSYFPSFEIMMDELRDYRFYKEDMIHPSKVAIAYIWEKFQLVWFSEETLKIMNKIASIQSQRSHRPKNPDSVEHKKFITNLNAEIELFRSNYPHISL